MNRVYFKNDYSEAATPEIINYLQEIGQNHYDGYGCDEICASAIQRIKNELNNQDCDVHFLCGGTQANLVMLDHILRPYEAVAAVNTGHINVHESGSIERTGHKVEALPSHNGKMSADDLEELLKHRTDEHMVKIGAVYISNSTEIGTVYTKAELASIYNVCQKYGIYLFIDGARLGVALTSSVCDYTMADLTSLCDSFYIGATKNGGLLGEAVVIINDDLKESFRNSMKQHGALLAKGFVIGAQFECLFKDGLYYRLATHSNEMALLLKKKLSEKGIEACYESPTNQQFFKFSNETIERLSEQFMFELWNDGEKESVIRLVCSWATKEEDIDQLIDFISKLN